VNDFKGVNNVTSLDGARGYLMDNLIDVVFISYQFTDEEVEQFIEDAKKIKGGLDSAYVFVLKDEDQEGSRAAKSILIGADGLLFEPYSVDRLVEITKLAARVKKDRGEARERAALEMILDEAMVTLDVLATLKADGIEPHTIIRKFHRSCEPLVALQNGKLANYLNTAVDKFEDAPLPEELPETHRYKGASNRVKTKVQDFLVEKIENEAKAAKE
jgi:hypothetical protein